MALQTDALGHGCIGCPRRRAAEHHPAAARRRHSSPLELSRRRRLSVVRVLSLPARRIDRAVQFASGRSFLRYRLARGRQRCSTRRSVRSAATGLSSSRTTSPRAASRSSICGRARYVRFSLDAAQSAYRVEARIGFRGGTASEPASTSGRVPVSSDRIL